jgi:hypothetical protein
MVEVSGADDPGLDDAPLDDAVLDDAVLDDAWLDDPETDTSVSKSGLGVGVMVTVDVSCVDEAGVDVPGAEDADISGTMGGDNGIVVLMSVSEDHEHVVKDRLDDAVLTVLTTPNPSRRRLREERDKAGDNDYPGWIHDENSAASQDEEMINEKAETALEQT